MLVQKQPDDASCLVTAFAMACDILVADLIAKIGIDYRQKVGYGGSHDYRGHNVQDIIRAVYETHSITEITDISVDGICTDPFETRCIILNAMCHFNGVLGLKNKGEAFGHTVAWIANACCVDPATGSDIPIMTQSGNLRILQNEVWIPKDIEVFWIVEARP